MSLLKTVNDVVYSITLKPNPKDDKAEVKIYFDSSADKRKHVISEYNYCWKEYRDYSAAMTLTERANAFSNLCSKRVAYARSIGYHPKKSNPKVWVKKDSTPPSPTNLA